VGRQRGGWVGGRKRWRREEGREGWRREGWKKTGVEGGRKVKENGGVGRELGAGGWKPEPVSVAHSVVHICTH